MSSILFDRDHDLEGLVPKASGPSTGQQGHHLPAYVKAHEEVGIHSILVAASDEGNSFTDVQTDAWIRRELNRLAQQEEGRQGNVKRLGRRYGYIRFTGEALKLPASVRNMLAPRHLLPWKGCFVLTGPRKL